MLKVIFNFKDKYLLLLKVLKKKLKIKLRLWKMHRRNLMFWEEGRLIFFININKKRKIKIIVAKMFKTFCRILLIGETTSLCSKLNKIGTSDQVVSVAQANSKK